MTKAIAIPFVGHIRDEKELESDKRIDVLERIHNQLRKDGYCYVLITHGDYKGSIAKFTPKDYVLEENVVTRNSSFGGFNILTGWPGRLSWDNKRNNPQFIMENGACEYLEEYSGETKLVRINLEEEKKKLLEKQKIKDIDGNTVSVGEKVLYMNLRYGCGGKLCRGEVVELKPHARDKYISVIIDNDEGERSELKHPDMQILAIKD